MKFLCVLCDEAMKLEQVERPETGSLSVVFTCGTCGHRMAMLTNPGETQLLRALDVRIGGRSAPAEPMEFVRSMLASKREAAQDAASPSEAGSAAAPTSGCPFSAMMNLAGERPDLEARADALREGSALGRTGVAEGKMTWAPEAERRLGRIPEFIRPMARQGIEQFATTRGHRRITEEVMEEARGALGM
jgi:hypothetical protein